MSRPHNIFTNEGTNICLSAIITISCTKHTQISLYHNYVYASNPLLAIHEKENYYIYITRAPNSVLKAKVCAEIRIKGNQPERASVMDGETN